MSGCSTDDKKSNSSIPDAGDSGTGNTCNAPKTVTVSISDGSQFELGWTGTGHGFQFTSGAEFHLEVGACQEDCEVCEVSGPVELPGRVQNRRCTTDVSVTCQKSNDCPPAQGIAAPARCAYLAGPGLPFDDTCSLIEFASTTEVEGVQGSVDFKSGAIDLALNMINHQVVDASCPACVPTGEDDDLDAGTDASVPHVCSGGPREGKACEIHGALGSSSYSYDCPSDKDPLLTVRIPLRMSSSSIAWTMDEVRPRCSAADSNLRKCWCGLCSEEPLRTCTSDRDCGTEQTCGAGPKEIETIPTRPDSCENECDARGEESLGECEGENKSCFPTDLGDTIVAKGSSQRVSANTYAATLAGLECIPPTGNVLVDQSVGLPGPARMFFLAEWQAN